MLIRRLFSDKTSHDCCQSNRVSGLNILLLLLRVMNIFGFTKSSYRTDTKYHCILNGCLVSNSDKYGTSSCTAHYLINLKKKNHFVTLYKLHHYRGNRVILNRLRHFHSYQKFEWPLSRGITRMMFYYATHSNAVVCNAYNLMLYFILFVYFPNRMLSI